MSEISLDYSKLPADITQEQVEKWLEVGKNAETMERRYGDAYTIEDVVRVMRAPVLGTSKSEKSERKPASDIIAKSVEDGSGVYTKERLRALVQERMDEMLPTLTDMTPYDEMKLRKMFQLLIVASRLTEVAGTQNIKTLSGIGTTIKAMEERASAISKELGLDRSLRMEADEKTSAVDAIQQMIDDAGKFALEQAMMIEHCDTLIGWMVCEFQEVQYTVSIQCPKCGEDVFKRHVPSKEQIEAAKVPDWAAEEEAGYKEEDGEEPEVE